jgi:hypothetical protein
MKNNSSLIHIVEGLQAGSVTSDVRKNAIGMFLCSSERFLFSCLIVIVLSSEKHHEVTPSSRSSIPRFSQVTKQTQVISFTVGSLLQIWLLIRPMPLSPCMNQSLTIRATETECSLGIDFDLDFYVA